jgi:sugar phosphate isomerase/epimerase
MAYKDIKFAVSLYSYQDNYYFKRLDFEGAIAAAAGSGAEGIEVLGDTMIPEWPYISDEFADRFVGLQYRYGVKGVCFEHWSDRAMWKNKQLTDGEMFERGVMYIKAAKKLGIPMVKLLHEEHIGPKAIAGYKLTDYGIIERLLPVAADLGVTLALEVHTHDGVGADYQQKYIELAEKTNLPFLGLAPDFSTFSYCMSTADIVDYTSRGAQKEILEFFRSKQRGAYFANVPFVYEAVSAEIEKMRPNDVTKQAIQFSMHMIGRKPPFDKLFKDLKDLASKLVYVHAKFYDLDENDCPDDMDYPRIFKALKEGGYKGYVASEFEGNRRMNMAGWVDEIEYVRRHQAYMRSLL